MNLAAALLTCQVLGLDHHDLLADAERRRQARRAPRPRFPRRTR
jgi:hypothetical protein